MSKFWIIFTASALFACQQTPKTGADQALSKAHESVNLIQKTDSMTLKSLSSAAEEGACQMEKPCEEKK